MQYNNYKYRLLVSSLDEQNKETKNIQSSQMMVLA